MTPVPTDSTRRKGGRRGRRLWVLSGLRWKILFGLGSSLVCFILFCLVHWKRVFDYYMRRCCCLNSSHIYVPPTWTSNIHWIWLIYSMKQSKFISLNLYITLALHTNRNLEWQRRRPILVRIWLIYSYIHLVCTCTQNLFLYILHSHYIPTKV